MPYNPKSKENLLQPWKPGISANPLGRPKGKISLARVLSECLKDRSFQGIPNPGDKTVAECLIEAMIVHVTLNGSPGLFQQIFDRNDGKIAEPVTEQEIDVEKAAAKLNEYDDVIDVEFDNPEAPEVQE